MTTGSWLGTNKVYKPGYLEKGTVLYNNFDNTLDNIYNRLWNGGIADSSGNLYVNSGYTSGDEDAIVYFLGTHQYIKCDYGESEFIFSLGGEFSGDIKNHGNVYVNSDYATGDEDAIIYFNGTNHYLKFDYGNDRFEMDVDLVANSIALASHSTRHQNGGSDAVKLDDLAEPDDNTDLNVGITKHGLCPKAPNDTTKFLRGDATWDVPSVASDLCHINTGTYTGDGTESQAISGVGFQPKYVKIWYHPTGAGNPPVFEKMDQSWSTYSYRYYASAGNEVRIVDNAIISLDSDGFTVDDSGGDNHPNKNAQVYDYLAVG